MRLVIRKVQFAPEKPGPQPSAETTRHFLMSDRSLHLEASLDKEVRCERVTQVPQGRLGPERAEGGAGLAHGEDAFQGGGPSYWGQGVHVTLTLEEGLHGTPLFQSCTTTGSPSMSTSMSPTTLPRPSRRSKSLVGGGGWKGSLGEAGVAASSVPDPAQATSQGEGSLPWGAWGAGCHRLALVFLLPGGGVVAEL